MKAMPNLPVALGKGVVGLYAQGGDAADRALVGELMAALGHAEWFEDEAAFQLAGILSGAGPAFLFRFIDALGQSAVALGLDENQARRLATAMVAGAGVLAASCGDSAAELARKVASPNGTTEAGLKILDADRALLALLGGHAHRRPGAQPGDGRRSPPQVSLSTPHLGFARCFARDERESSSAAAHLEQPRACRDACRESRD